MLCVVNMVTTIVINTNLGMHNNGQISKALCNKWEHHTIYPFLCVFYAIESPLYYNQPKHESNVIIIPSTMGTHQATPRKGTIRSLFSTTKCFPSCLFPFIIDDIHIIGPLSIVSCV
jgi:hypothetical protein